VEFSVFAKTFVICLLLFLLFVCLFFFLLVARRLTNYALIKRLLLRRRPFFKKSLTHLRLTRIGDTAFGSVSVSASAFGLFRSPRSVELATRIKRQKLMCIINLLLHFAEPSFCYFFQSPFVLVVVLLVRA